MVVLLDEGVDRKLPSGGWSRYRTDVSAEPGKRLQA